MIIQPNHFAKKLLNAAKLAFAISIAVSPVIASKAANFYWTGTGSTAAVPAGGNWDATTTDWSTTPTGATGTAWGAAGSIAYFGGVDGTYGVSVNATVNKPTDLIFLNSGYTLSNSITPETITYNGTGSGAAPNIVVAAGKIATIGTNITISGTTVLWGFTNSAAGGELDIQNGGTLSASGGTAGMVGAGTVTSVKPGGRIIHSASASGSFILGSKVSDNCTLSVDGGTVSVTANNTGVIVGGSGTAAALGGTLTINAGSFTMGSGNTTVPMTEGILLGCQGTNNLNGGTLSVNEIIQGTGNGYINFNGGTLKPVNGAFAATFLNGLTAAYVRNGGAVIDHTNFNITIGQALLHSALAGDAATDGGLTVTNSGTIGSLTLTGVNTYNGPTTVKTGAYLATTTRSTGGGSYTANDGATLEVQVPTAGGQLAVSSLTDGASGNLTNVLTLGANASTTTAPLAIGGALALNGTVTINVSASSLSGPNIYPLISYGSMSGSGHYVAGTLPTLAGFFVSLTNDTTAKMIELVVATPPAAESWAVGNGTWDTTSLNWIPLGGGAITNYSEGALVAFDDSASGTSPITVTLAANRTPGVITNNSTKNYVLTGNQNINSPQLIKDGTSTLTLDNGSGNSFGGIAINNGILQLGNADTGGSLGTVAISDNGTLQFNRTDSITVTNLVSGSGGITQSGSGVLTLGGADTYTGNTVVNAGTLIVTPANAGVGNYSVADGATFGVQISSIGAQLNLNNLMLGTSSNLTNVYTLGAFGSTSIAPVSVIGNLTLNGTVAVNVTASGLATGTYVLMAYSSISGSGSFVLNSASPVNGNAVTLTNDTSVNKLELICTAVTNLVWDAGNTANGATIDAGSGTWDFNPANTVWNDNGVNRSWVNAVPANFAGADGTWNINLAANVSTPAMIFNNNGYAITSAAPQTITFSATGSGGSPNIRIAPGVVATIGTNVTVTENGTTIWGNLTNTPGGELDIQNGATLSSSGTTIGQTGAGTVTSVKTGGRLIATGTGNFILGAQGGDSCILSVDGGTVVFSNSAAVRVGGSGAAGNLSGTLTINSGLFTMSAANTIVGLTNGVFAGNLGTNNLNGGVLSVNSIAQGAGNGYINFNGGTLRAVSGSFASSFLNGLTTANVRNGGAVIDNNGFNLTVGQALVHSTLSGDNATDGGLTVMGSGSVTLTGANTYTGNTTINAGRLALSGSGSLGSGSVIVAGGASLDVSAVTFALASGQVLTNSSSSATLIGNVNASSGTISLTYSSGTPSFAVTNGTLTLSGSTVFKVNNTGSQLAAGSYKLVATNTAGLVAGALPPVVVGGSGVAGGASTSLQVINSELYLVVASSQPPVITGIGISGTTLHLTATNGAANGNYVLLQSTNIVQPLNQWTPVLTNNFDGSGNLNLSTNIIVPGTQQQFFRISQ